jgi:hypothetical protein
MSSSVVENNGTKQLQWTTLDMAPQSEGTIEVTNGSVKIPSGLNVVHDFVSEEEIKILLEQVDQESFIWEGFEQRRRVQRYVISEGEKLPSSLVMLRDRLVERLGHSPQHISVEEYPRNQLSKHFNTSKSAVSRFESNTLCKCDQNKCSCFVAHLVVRTPVVEFLNRPMKRHNNCWDWYSENHQTGLLMQERSLFVKTKECLWDWRSRISSIVPEAQERDRILLIKFHSLPVISHTEDEADDDKFGYVPSLEDLLPRRDTMPPLEDLLTFIVTTSPIKSNPSTELFERVFQTFLQGGSDFALKCHKVIVCDGCRQKDENVSKRHANTKQAMRNGIVNSEQFENYEKFKEALRELCSSAPSDSPFFNSVVEELDSRQGYGFALRHALRHCVTTPFVIVIQHDRTFMRPTPIHETVKAMWHHRNIKYVGMSMRSNLLYRDIFLGKYGKAYMEEMSECTLRPPELALNSNSYGPDSHSTENMEYSGQTKLRDNIRVLVDTYRGSQQYADHREWLETHPLEPDTCQLSLTPTFFWYDNVHICETAHYRDFVFDPKYKMVVRGGFVEDKLSPVIKKTVERLGLVKGHASFGCYLLDDHSGMFFTGHLDGGTYIDSEERKSLATINSSSND